MKFNHKYLSLVIISIFILSSFLWHKPLSVKGAGIDFLIVYSPSVNAVSALEDFASYKESLGYVTEIISASQISRESSGSDQAEKLRNYFKTLQSGQGLKYVLIVGDPFDSRQRDRKSTGGMVPMRYCYPSPQDHGAINKVEEDIDRIPTDMYYADLTGEWDSDGDGYFGEYREDRVNLVPEIYVGRIPFDDRYSIETILEKTIEFEERTTASKKRALLMATNNSTKIDFLDNALLTELIWKDLLSKNSFSRTTLYEKAGLIRSEYESTYPLNQNEAVKQINSGSYGLTYIVSNGGYMDSLMRYVWMRDKNFNDTPDPEECEWFPIINSEDAQSFSTQNTSIYFVSGYMPLASDWDMDNIGKELLMTKAVAIMGESRLGYFYPQWKTQRDGGMHSIFYYFTQALLSEKTVGEALYHSFAYSSESDYYNAYSFGTLYGDPTLGLEQRKKAEDKPPGAPRNLKASLSNNNVALSWSPSTKGTYTIDGYTVFRGTDPDVLSYLSNVSASETRWEDKTASAGNTYYYYIKAFDIKKNFSDASNTVSISIKSQPTDTIPPKIMVKEPQNNTRTKQSSIKVSGQITDDDTGVAEASLNNKKLTLDRSGNFTESVLLSLGSNSIIIQATDHAGNEAKVNLTVFYDKEETPIDKAPPLIKIFSPKNGDIFSSDTVEINGRIWDEDSGIDRATMNSMDIILARDGTFAAPFMLQSGTNKILFEAWDNAGNYASEELFLVLSQETIIKLTIGSNLAYINGIPVPLDVPPTIINGRTMVPIRFISEGFGAEVEWDGETRTVRIYFAKTFTRVTLQINNTIARVNDRIVNLDTPPMIINGRTMVPIRFISEAFGAQVDWDGATRTVTITLKS